MKKILIMLFVVLISMYIKAQTTVFSDNFESGTTSWTLTNSWGTSTLLYHSSNHSLTESPVGNYTDNQNSTATMTTGVNLSTALSATLSFWAVYSIEAGFDYMFVDVSINGGITWVNLDSFDDTSSVWTQYSYSLGGFVGQSNVKVRFRFFSDGAEVRNGMNIDDISIVTYTTDNAPPLIIHTPTLYYEGPLLADSIKAELIDISGIKKAKLIYAVDGGTNDTIDASTKVGNLFTFIIPAQQAGAKVNYHIYATDSTTTGNPAATSIYKYISGKHTYYDNGQVDFVDSIGVGSGAAMRMTLAGPTKICGLLIRNYTDVNRPNDSILVHVWTSVGGLPGTDLITPVKVFPAATLSQTSDMTIVDLRAFSNALSNLSGDVFIGYTVPTGNAWATIAQPSLISRSYKYSTTGWTLATGTSGTSDFHFRVITDGQAMPPTVGFSFNATAAPSISFINNTIDANSYRWNFGDGTPFDTAANPTHVFGHNGQFLVCLKATNNVGSDSTCKHVLIQSYPVPVSDFSFNISGDPNVLFTDVSANNPTSWYWDFDDNNTISTQQNPSHVFPAIGGTFNVCLTASSPNGNGNNICKNVVLSVGSGIDESKNNDEISIYPNPSSDQTTIEFYNKNYTNLSLTVYDLNGRKMDINYSLNGEGFKLQRGNLSSGQYVFRIFENDKIIHEGVLIIR
jgi:PKD repeat protein